MIIGVRRDLERDLPPAARANRLFQLNPNLIRPLRPIRKDNEVN